MSQDMATSLRTCLRSNIPALFVSAPGMGKSSFTKWFAAQEKLLHIDINLSQNESVDVHGCRILAKEQRQINGKACTVTVQAPPDYAIDAAEAAHNGAGALINFEELTCIPPPEAGPTLGIFSDYTIGGIKLNKRKVGIVACCNPPALSAGGWKLAPPSINRFCKIPFHVEIKDWAEGFSMYWGFPQKVEWQDFPLPESEWGPDRAIVADFAKQWPVLINVLPLPDQVGIDGAAEESFCSYRTLDYASRIVTCCRVDHLSDTIRQRLLCGLIGSKAGTQLSNYIEHYKLPRPAELLAQPSLIGSTSITTDKLFSVMMGCTAEVANRKRESDSRPNDKAAKEFMHTGWLNLWEICHRVRSNGGPKDIVALTARHLCANENYPPGAIPPAVVNDIVNDVRQAGVKWSK